MIRTVERMHGVSQGDKFGGRTVLGRPFSCGRVPSGQLMWGVVVQCQCGRIQVVKVGDVKTRSTCLSCASAKSSLTHGFARHTGERSRLYFVWASMRGRCNNENASGYKYYGGRGIYVCEEWSDFPAFRGWALGAGYAEGLEIDRNDVNGPYSPDNCRWVSEYDQQRNKRSTRFLVAFGERKCLTDWASDSRSVVCLTTLSSRLKKGWDIEAAITTEARK